MSLPKRFSAFVSAFLCAASVFAASYKVETFGGVPFVSVDGKAVRSRHFLGWTGGGTTPRVADKWEDFSLDVSHSADTNSAALRIIVGNDVSELCVSKLELENLSDGSRVPLYDFSAKPCDKSKLSWLFPKEIRPQPEVAMQNEVLDGMPVLRISKKQKDAREGDTVLARYADGSNAVVLRTSGKHPQMFAGTTVVPESLYRLMAVFSGVHVYTKQPAAVYANGAYVSITATTSEVHKIDFGREVEAFDALSGERLGKARVFEFEMNKGDVKFLRLGAGNF